MRHKRSTVRKKRGSEKPVVRKKPEDRGPEDKGPEDKGGES